MTLFWVVRERQRDRDLFILGGVGDKTMKSYSRAARGKTETLRITFTLSPHVDRSMLWSSFRRGEKVRENHASLHFQICTSFTYIYVISARENTQQASSAREDMAIRWQIGNIWLRLLYEMAASNATWHTSTLILGLCAHFGLYILLRVIFLSFRFLLL